MDADNSWQPEAGAGVGKSHSTEKEKKVYGGNRLRKSATYHRFTHFFLPRFLFFSNTRECGAQTLEHADM